MQFMSVYLSISVSGVCIAGISCMNTCVSVSLIHICLCVYIIFRLAKYHCCVLTEAISVIKVSNLQKYCSECPNNNSNWNRHTAHTETV